MKKLFFLLMALLALHVSALRAHETDSLSLVKKFFSKFTKVTVSPEGIFQSRVSFPGPNGETRETNLFYFPSEFIQLNGGANITVRSLKTVHVFTLAIFDLSLRVKNGYRFSIWGLDWDTYLLYSKSFCDFGSENNFRPKFHLGNNYLGVGLECAIPEFYSKKGNPIEIIPFFEIGDDFRGNILPIIGVRIDFLYPVWER